MPNKFSIADKVQVKLGPLLDKLNKNVYLMSVRDAMLAYMPFTLIASIFLLLANFPIPQFTDFITKLLSLEDASIWQAKLMYVKRATLDIAGIIVVLSVAKSLATKLNTNETQASLTALVSFLVLTPFFNIDGVNVLQTNSIDAQSIFLALIVGIFSVLLFNKIDKKGLKIKMPSSVPPAVSAPFESIVPSLIVVLFFYAVRIGLELLLNSDALSIINDTIGKPLTYLGGSIGGILVIKLVEQFLWFFGLHGSSIVNAVTTPIMQVLEDQNRTASLLGQTPSNIIGMSFRDQFSTIGVVGAIIAIFLVAKSKQYKEIGKLAGVPYIFNIGEPTLFGVPLMLNFSYVIPFIFTNVITTIIAYVSFYLKIVPIPSGLVQVPWTTPPIVSGYLVTGDVRGALLQIVLLVVSTLIWLPFVKRVDKQLYSQEKRLIKE